MDVFKIRQDAASMVTNQIGSLGVTLLSFVLCMVTPQLAIAQLMMRPEASTQARGATVDLPQRPLAAERLEDASLWGVHFIDHDQGWCVGDMGIVLQTRDGGENWMKRETGTNASLRAVHFQNPLEGIVVGGWYESDTTVSRGVILRTQDGGKSWQPVANDLPALHQFRRLEGGAWLVTGDWSHIHLGRVFLSDDQGRSWRAVDAESPAQVATISLDESGILIGDRQGIVTQFPLEPERTRSLSAPGVVRYLRHWDHIVVAGLAAGGVSLSLDGGRNWVQLNHRLPNEENDSAAKQSVSFHPQAATITRDGSIMMVGIPGDRMMRVSNGGISTFMPTGVDQPLHAIHFQDQYRGWAVGAFGTVITTRDGGANWRPQRGGKRHAMVLGIAAKAEHLPWPAVASESLEYGRRIAFGISKQPIDKARMLTATDPETPDYNPLLDDVLHRTAYASTFAGGGEVLALEGGERWIDDLETAIASFRPKVLVLGADITRDQLDAVAGLLTRYGVERVLQMSSDTTRGEVTMHASAILPVAGALTRDLWSAPLEIVAPNTQLPDKVSLRRVWDQTSTGELLSGLATGMSLDGRTWKVPEGHRLNLQVLQARSGEAQRIDRLIEKAVIQDDETLRRIIHLLIQQSPQENRMQLNRLLIQRANHRDTSHFASQPRVYIEALRYAVEHFSDEPLGRWSKLRLTAVEHSTEWRHLQHTLSPTVAASMVAQTASVASHRSPFESNASLSAPNFESFESSAVVNASGAAASETSLTPGTDETNDGDLSSRVPEAVYSLGLMDSMPWRQHPLMLAWKIKYGIKSLDTIDQTTWIRIVSNECSGDWRAMDNINAGRKILAQRVATADKPRPWLDGQLNDPAWEPVAPENGSDVTAIAFDDRYLYIAVRTTFLPNDSFTPANRRRRDEAIQDQPRICIELDVDADFHTCYQLMVDAQGRTYDAIDGFAQWQPDWWVSTSVDNGQRCVELAIDRQYLDASPLLTGAHWRMRVTRLSGEQTSTAFLQQNPRGWIDVEFASLPQ